MLVDELVPTFGPSESPSVSDDRSTGVLGREPSPAASSSCAQASPPRVITRIINGDSSRPCTMEAMLNADKAETLQVPP